MHPTSERTPDNTNTCSLVQCLFVSVSVKGDVCLRDSGRPEDSLLAAVLVVATPRAPQGLATTKTAARRLPRG